MRRRSNNPPWRRRQAETGATQPSEVEDLPPSAHSLAQSLAVPETPEEVAGERTALTAYRALFGTTPETGGTDGRKAPVVVSLAGARIGVAAAGAVLLGIGGLSAAAYSGALPDGAQNVAHEAIGAPAARGKGHQAKARAADAARNSASGSAVGPDAKGPAAHGLCNAFDPAKDKGGARTHSVAYRNLVQAAGGETKIKAYCASVEKAHADKAAKDAGKATGKATGTATGKATGRPTDRSADKGKPSAKPEKDKPAAPPTTTGTPSRTTSPSASSAPTTSPATTSATSRATTATTAAGS
jgi:hypothetical protein